MNCMYVKSKKKKKRQTVYEKQSGTGDKAMIIYHNTFNASFQCMINGISTYNLIQILLRHRATLGRRRRPRSRNNGRSTGHGLLRRHLHSSTRPDTCTSRCRARDPAWRRHGRLVLICLPRTTEKRLHKLFSQ